MAWNSYAPKGARMKTLSAASFTRARGRQDTSHGRIASISKHNRERTVLSPMAGYDLPAVRADTRTCPACLGAFTPSRGRRITCSDTCRRTYVADWPHEIDDAEVVARGAR